MQTQNIGEIIYMEGPAITNRLHFEQASIKHKGIIFHWLDEPHIKEFWDNTQEHKDDILNFIHGRKQHYFYGTTKYWLGYCDGQPFSFILTDELLASQDLSELHLQFLSKTGRTITLDFGIGNSHFLGKGLAAPTLAAFTDFYRENIDPNADTFFIDPDVKNPRAAHVYEKAGFELVGDYIMNTSAFKNHQTMLMIKRYLPR